jgi:hypothetical protein
VQCLKEEKNEKNEDFIKIFDVACEHVNLTANEEFQTFSLVKVFITLMAWDWYESFGYKKEIKINAKKFLFGIFMAWYKL